MWCRPALSGRQALALTLTKELAGVMPFEGLAELLEEFDEFGGGVIVEVQGQTEPATANRTDG